MKVFDRIKRWLTGGSSSSSSKIREANRTSYYGGGVSSKSVQREVRRSITKAEAKREGERQTARYSAFKSDTSKPASTSRGGSESKSAPTKPDPFNKANAFKATPVSVSKAEEKDRQTSPFKAKSSVTDPKQEAAKAARERAEKKRKENLERLKADKEARKAKKEERHEAFHAATNHRYDVAEKGISEEERNRRKQNIRTATLGEMVGGRDDEALDVMKAKMKYDKLGESFKRGAADTATASITRLLASKLPEGGRKEAEEYYQKNKSRLAEGAGNLAGGMALYGGTANTFEGLGTKAVGRAAETAVGRKLGAEALARTMAGNGAKAAIARSLVGDAIQDSTIGLFDTAMDVASRDDLQTPNDYAREILKGQAINYGMGLAGNAGAQLLPIAGRAVGRAWGDFADESRRLNLVPKGTADLGEAVANANGDEIIATGRNWIEGRDLQLWKSGRTLYVGDPADVSTWKSFGNDIPENRAAAEAEFNFVNNRRTPEEQARRRGKTNKTSESKPKSKVEKRPDGVRKFTDKQLLDLKKRGEAGSLTKEEYDYYIYNRAEDDPFLEEWDAVGTGAKPKKGKRKSKKASTEPKSTESVKSEEPKAEQAETGQAKVEESEAEKTTKTLTKKQLEAKKKRSDKRLKQIEDEIKRSPYASQYEQDALSAKYTKELEYRKKLDAQIKEAEASADGTITVGRGKKKTAKEVDESNVTVTKGKEEFVEEPPKPKKEKKKKAKSNTSDKAERADVETETADVNAKAEKAEGAEAAASPETRKDAKSIKSLENKIENSNKKIQDYDEALKRKRKDGASEKSIKYTQDQRSKEMKKRKDLQRELESLKASAESAETPKTSVSDKALKTDAEVKPPEPKPSKKVKSLENRIRNSDERIEKLKKQIAEKKKAGASEKSVANLEAQRKAEIERRKDLKKELKELTGSSKVSKKTETPKAETKSDAKVSSDIEATGNKKVDSLEKRVAYANDNIDKLKNTLKEKRANGASEKSIAYTEEQLTKEKARLKEIKKDLKAAQKEAEAKASNAEVQQPKEAKPDKASKAETVKAEAPEKPLTKAAQARAKKEAARQRLDVLLESAKEKQAVYDGGDTDALKDLVSIENEARQAYRDAGMSRADEYKESKKLFDKHKRALEKLEKQNAKAKEQAKDKALEHYKREVAKSIDDAKAKDAETVNVGGKTYSAVSESPFDEASTRTTRTTPKFTSSEQKAAKAKTAKTKKAKGAAKKLDEKANTFRRNPSPRGENLHKNVYGKVKGEALDEAIEPPTAKDYLEAKKVHLSGQASNEKEVVSRAGTSLMNATTADAQRDFLRNKWQDGSLNYVRVKNKEKYAEVMQHWVDDPEAVARDIIRYNDDISKLGADKIVDMHYQAHCVMKMLRKEIDNPALTEAERESAKEIYSAAASLTQRLSSKSGQINQFQGVMVGCSPARRADNALENIVDMLDRAKGFRKNAKVEVDGKMVSLSENASERRNQIRSLLLDNDEVSKALTKVYDAATEEEYGEAMDELLRKSYTLNSATGFDYLQQWRYLAMLGNPKTHLRNIVGNVTFGNIRKISNAIRGGLENGLEGWATKHGLEMEMHGGLSPKAWRQAQSEKFVTDEAGRSAWESFKKHSNEILGDQKYNTPEMKNFLAELNTKALTAEDDFFRGRAYREQYIKGYNKYAKKGEITDAIKQKLHNEALRESQIATFNEFNELAQILAKSQNGLYDANASVGKKVVSMGSNALLPFTKVPANILKQSVNYSPAGLVKGYAHILDAAKKGDSELLNKAIDEMASGLTGTGIAALGFFLGTHTDRFTTNAGNEDAAAKFKKQQGVQNYSVMFKGANGKTYSMTLDWLVPASSTFFMGVEIANQFKNGLGGANVGEALGNLSQITSRVIDPVLETSMLSGIYNIVEDSRKSASYDDQQSFANIVVRELVQSYLSSYVPTLQGQIARTAYGADKMVVGDSDPEFWVNSMKVKMGLANTDILGGRLGDDVNAYGEVKNKKDGSFNSYAKSFAKNAVLPANIQEVSLSDLDKQKIKEYEDYVDAGGDPADKEYLFPKKSYKKNFTVGKKGADPTDVKLSNEQVSLYNQAKTSGGEEGMRAVLEGIMFNRYDKDSNGKRTILKNGYTEGQKEKLIQKYKGKSLREVEEWLYKQPQFRSASEEEQRKTLNALWSYSQQGKSQGAKRVGEQAVIKDQGGDINEYNFKNELSKTKQVALAPFVEDGTLTYDEIVDFARNAGKTYYYENDEGGTANTYYNKKQMLEYLEAKGYSPEKAEALYNAFKTPNAKPYGASSGRGYGRRGYRHYGHRRGGSGKAAKHDVTAFKAKNNNVAAKKVATPKSSPSAGKSTANAGKTSVKVSSTRRTTNTTPKVKIPLNVKTVKPSKSTGKVRRTNLAAALDDLQKTQKKVAPPKARSSK